jgi:hypothetical protein
MKKILNSNYYSFDAGNNRIDFTNFPEFEFQKLYAVIDITEGKLIYSTAGQASGLDGSFSTPYLNLVFDVTGFSSSDELQIIYEMASQPISDSEENPILSTLDIPSEKFGLDVNILNSSFGGQIGRTMPYPYADSALAVAINSGGKLQSPAIDPVSSQLIVDVGQNGPVQVAVLGGVAVTQNTIPWVSAPCNSGGIIAAFDAGASDSTTQRVVLANNSLTAASTSTLTFSDFSATFTTSATSSAYSSTAYRSQNFQIKVGTVTGTNPTMDYSIEESFDGTTWFTSYQFPRITTSNEVHRSPNIRFVGQNFRYVRTIGGTSPSFGTTLVSRVSNASEGNYHRNFIDRTLAPNTASSATPSYFAEGCRSFNLIVTMNGGGSVMPTITLQGSEDSINWFAISTGLLGVISSSVSVASTVGLSCRYVRAIVTGAGTGSTLNNIVIKGRV